MSCLIKRNQDNKIVNVTTPAGEKSELFDAIHSNLFLSDPETSVSIFNNAYSKEVKKMFKDSKVFTYKTGEPKLYYQSQNNKQFDNLEDLLIEDQTGVIHMGFKNPQTSEFIPVAKFDTNSSERSRFLVKSVQTGVLSADRRLGEDGVTRFVGKGFFRETSLATARMAQFDAMVDLGVVSKVNKLDGTIEFDFDTSGLVEAVKDSGSEVIRIEEIPQKVNDSNYQNKIDLLVRYMTSIGSPRPINSKQKKQVSKKTIDGLEKSLYSFLNSAGIAVTSLENYKKSYNTRYGQDPDIQALADVGNRVIAFKDGLISLEDLTEETAHIAIETYNDQNSIVSALALTPFTEEYKEYNQVYRIKYQEFFSGVELEDQVRKEILGKYLANRLKSNFSKSNQTQEQLTLTDKVKQLWESFINFIKGNTKPHHTTSLNKILDRVADAIIRNDENVFDANSTSRKFYYSLMSQDTKTIETSLRQIRKTYENLFRSALKQPVPNQPELERIVEKMNEADILSSVSTIVGIAKSEILTLELNAARAENAQKKEDKFISTEDNHRYVALDENIIPTLNKIRLQLDSLELSDDQRKVVSNLASIIDDISLRKSKLDPRIKQDYDNIVDDIVSEVVYDMSTEEKTKYLDSIEGGMRDVSFLGSKFGLMSHSSNPLNRLAAIEVSNMGYNISQRTGKIMNPVIDKIYSENLQKFQKDITKQLDGENTMYYPGPINFALADKEELSKEIDVLVSLSGKDKEEITRLYKNSSASEILGDDLLVREFRRQMNEYKVGEAERPYTPEYYEEEDKRFKKAETSSVTIEIKKNMNAEEYSVILKSQAKNPDGTIDKSKLTEAERQKIIDIRKKKAVVKNAYDQFGYIKDGLKKAKFSELSRKEVEALPKAIKEYITNNDSYIGDVITVVEGRTKEDLSEDALVAFEMSNLDILYYSEQASGEKTRVPVDEFLQQIENIEKEGGIAYDWVTSNATITFTPEYYENIGSNLGFADQAQEYINKLDPTERRLKQSSLNRYKELQRVQKDLLRQNKKVNKPIEVDAHNMNDVVRKRLIEIEQEIRDIERDLSIPSEVMQQMGVRVSSRGVNEDYKGMLRESGKSSFDFAQQHMTRRNATNVNNFAIYVEDSMKRQPVFTKKSYEKFIQEKIDDGTVRDGMSQQEIVSTLKDAYAERYVASYFQRYEPQGYQQVIDALKSGDLKVSDVIKNRQQFIDQYPALQYIEFAPDYSWSEDINNLKFMNPKYSEDTYYRKLNIEKYTDNEFFEEFGIDKQKFLKNPTLDLEKLEPTKNKEKYELLKTLVNLRKMAIESYGDTAVVNPYLKPQMSKSGLEKIAKISDWTKISQVKDNLKDFFQSRKDEKLYGEVLDDDNKKELGGDLAIKLVPKYLQSRLESPDLLTTNIIEAALVDVKQAIVHQERSKSLVKMKALQWKLKGQTLKDNGLPKITKKGEVSNSAKRLEEYVDHHIFGIQQTSRYQTQIMGKTVDISKIATSLQGWARFNNLGFNWFVDLTSATTGIINNAMDRAVGRYYHKSSNNRGKGIAASMASKYILETGVVNKKSDANNLLEFLGVKEITGKIKNSGFSRGMKLIEKSPYGMSEFCNIPVTFDIIATVLCDYRFSDGEFRDYKTFVAYQKFNNPQIKKSEIDSLWSEIKDDSFYDNLDIKNQTFNSRFSEKYPLHDQEEFDKISKQVRGKVKQVIQTADGVLNEIDQVAAQRNFYLNFFMMHKGWLSIIMTRRFKNRHYNEVTGQNEEGHYLTLFNFIRDSIKSPKDIVKIYSEYEDFKKENLKGALIEHGFMVFLCTLGSFIFAADDDDDTMMEDLAQLIYLRTVSEFNTSQTIGIPGSLLETAESPIASMGTFQNLNPLSLLYNVNSEDAEGNNKSWKQLKKAVPFLAPLRRYDQWADLQNQIDYFRYMNAPTLLTLGSKTKEEADQDVVTNNN